MKKQYIKNVIPIDKIHQLENVLSSPECSYNVSLESVFFSLSIPITLNDIPKNLQEIWDPNIRGTFIEKSFDEFQSILRNALAWSSTDLHPLGILQDKDFIDSREKMFWDIIRPYFSQMPKIIYEYEPLETAYYFSGVMWEFFLVLCHDNHGLVLEGAAYD